MKIINIIPYVSNQYGGPPYVAKSLNKLFNKHKFESYLLTVDDKLELEESNIVYFKKTTDRFFFSFDFLVNSIKYIKNSDVLYIHGIYTFLSLWSSIIGLIYKKDIFLLPHGMFDKNSINSSGFIKNIIRNIFVHSIGRFQVIVSKKIIFNSNKEQKNSTFSKNSIVIPNGVDLDFINNIRCSKDYFENDKINLFFLGRVHNIKGIELLIDSINDLSHSIQKKIKVTIAGNGDVEYVKYLHDKCDSSVFNFIGHIKGNEKYCYLKQCDIYIQPSFTEGLSISMLEAMACKVNMITTNKVGLYEELIEKNAAMVINYNKNELKHAIARQVRDESDYKERGYKIVKAEYSWNMIINSYIKLMKDNK